MLYAELAFAPWSPHCSYSSAAGYGLSGGSGLGTAAGAAAGGVLGHEYGDDVRERVR